MSLQNTLRRRFWDGIVVGAHPSDDMRRDYQGHVQLRLSEPDGQTAPFIVVPKCEERGDGAEWRRVDAKSRCFRLAPGRSELYLQLTRLLRSMPTFTTWHQEHSGTIFSRIPPGETVYATVWVPPLSPFYAEPVGIYTYNACWLALLALDKLAGAELELATLPLAEPGHEALTPSALHRKSELYIIWAIALLELVLLYRLHLELEARPRELRRARDSEGKLFAVGATASQHSRSLLPKIDSRLEVHQSATSTVAGSGLDPLLEGTFSDCAGVLDHFLKTRCKIDVAPNQALHHAWLASIKSLAEEVLQFMATQVLSLVRIRAFCEDTFAE